MNTEEVKKNQATEVLIAVMQKDLSHIQDAVKAMQEEIRNGFTRLENNLVPRSEHEEIKRRVRLLEDNNRWAIKQLLGPILGIIAIVIATVTKFGQ